MSDTGIEIVEESGPHDAVRVLTLRLDGIRKAQLISRPGSPPELVWLVYGPQYWPEAQRLLTGLLHLGVQADILASTPRKQGKK
jgi:hypothetical protein